MILAIDIGNSEIKCAVVTADRVLGRESIDTRQADDPVALPDMVRRVTGAVLSVQKAVLSTVVPEATAHVVAVIERQLGFSPQMVSHSMRMPFELAVPVPSQVGTDRIAAATGAVGTKGRNALVIDAGSAVTVDVVRNGRFLGGVIIAGPSISLRALHRYASQLPMIDYPSLGEPFPDAFDTTHHSMALGAGLGCVGAVRESVKFLESAVGSTSKKFLTGGFGGALAERLPRAWQYDPDLALKGLYILGALNRRKSD